MSTTTIGIFSDVHALSRFGVVPPAYRLAGGMRVDPTANIQRYLWRCWTEFVEWCPRMDALIFNGDALAGEARHDQGMFVVSTDYADQAAAFVQAVRPLREKAQRLFIVRGTPYHEGKAAEALEAAAAELDAERWWGTRRTGYVLNLQARNLRINASHHMTRGFLYRGTAADRTAMLANIAENLARSSRADVIIRSHLHMKHIARAHGKWVVLTPGWTVIDPHAIKTMEYYRALVGGDIGAIVLEVDDRGMRWLEFDRPPYREEVFRVDSAEPKRRD